MCRAAARVLDVITAELAVGDVRRVDGTEYEDACVYVGRLQDITLGEMFSLGRYALHEDGAVEPDPEVTFLRRDEKSWYPLTYQCGDIYRSGVTSANGGELRTVPAIQARLVRLANMWLRRIDVMLATRNEAASK